MLCGTRRCAMRKLYIVRLTKQERVELQSVVKKLKGTGQKVRRAQILLKADADGPNWTDQRIAEAFSCRTRTVERQRQRLVGRSLKRRSTVSNERSRPWRNGCRASRKPGSSRRDSDHRRRAMPIGRCGC